MAAKLYQAKDFKCRQLVVLAGILRMQLQDLGVRFVPLCTLREHVLHG